MARKVEVQIVGDSRSLERAFGRVQAEGSKLERGLKGIGKASAIAIGVGAGAGLVGLGIALHTALGEYAQQTKVAAQTNAVIKSTGDVSNVSAKHVDALATSLLNKSGVDDEVVKSGENMLLTFKNIRNEAGRNNDIFDQATKLTLDMDSAMSHGNVTMESLSKKAILVGKALNDPIRGMTSLRRVGVTFSDDQVKLIKHLEDTGHHLEAQKIVLRELRSEFGGSAAAIGKTLPGQLNIIRESLRNFAADALRYAIPTMTTIVGLGRDLTGFIGRVAQAPSLKVGLNIAGSGVRDLGSRVRKSVENAIGSVDWKPIGTQLATTIGSSIVFGANVLDKALTSISAWVEGHSAQIASIGAELAVRMAVTLTDPAFWLHHLDLLFLVIAVGFGKGIGRLGGFVGKEIVRVLGPVFEQGAGEVALFFMRGVARLPSLVGDSFAVLGTIVARGVGAIVREIGSAPGRLAQVFRLGVLVTVARVAIEGVKSAWNAFTGWITVKALLAARAIVEPFTHLPSFLGGWARGAKNAINSQLDQIHAEQMAGRVEHAAARISATRPQIAAAGAAVRNLAAAINSVPSDTTIRFIVKTITFTPGSSPRGGPFQGGGHAAGGRIAGARTMADSVPAMLSPGEFVVTGGGERMLESMTFPGVLNWLQGTQPRHFAGGGRATVGKTIEYDRLFRAPTIGGGGQVSTHGLVPQVLNALSFARGHGWHGSVTSGFRSYSQQAALYARYLAGGPLAARPGTSSHERGQAVDVTDYGTFGGIMAGAPAGSRLYNRLGGADPVHYSVTGYQGGGRVVGPARPGPALQVPPPPPSPLPALRRRVAVLRREERGLKAQIARVDATLASLHKALRNAPKTRAQKARRASIQKQINETQAHSNRLHARLKAVQAELHSLGERIQEVIQHDYSVLPVDLQLEEAEAALTETTADDLTALTHAQSYLESQLRRPGITKAQKVQLLQALAGVRGQIHDLSGAPDTGGAGDTGGGAAAPDVSADLQAQLAQANTRAAASAESARLANAFVATGVFASSTPGVGGGGNSPTIIFQNLIPDADQIMRATAAIAQGAGLQPYRVTSVEPSGF